MSYLMKNHEIALSSKNNMENLHNSDCCSPNQETNSNCCTPATLPVEKNEGGFKKKFGLLILGLAFVLAVSSAFKITTSTNEIGFLPPAIEDFEWMDTDKEVAYVLLKGDNEEQNKQLSSQISEVVLELNGTDGSAGHFELTPSYEQYADFVETTGVESVPTVVVLGRGGNLSLLNGDSVSSIKLYKAYLAATTPAASCNPAACASSKSCTPAQKAKCGVKKSN